MKLNKLYTNKDTFKNIKFNSGLNVVYADVKTKVSANKNAHNLGKTLLSELIDILLLKGITPKNHFLFTTKNELGENVFSSYIFYLEILLNSGRFLTIKREVLNHSKISFSLNSQETRDFSPPKKWDEESVSIEKAKVMLAEYLNFDFFKNKNYDYRKSINYSIRRQGDYADIYRLTKFKGRDIFWKPFMFDFLGFDGNLLLEKYENDKTKEEIQKYINKLKNEFSININDRDEIVAQLQIKEANSIEMSKEIDKFNFYEQDKNLIKEGVEDFELKISELNTASYNLEFDINKLRNSIKNQFSFDLHKIDKVFNEVNLYFPEQLKKDYEDLLNFNKEITEERNKLLRKTLKRKNDSLNKIREELKSLNLQKEELLSVLQNTDTFNKFKSYQKDLVKVESQLIQLREKLKTINLLIEKEEQIDNIEKKLELLTKSISSEFQHTDKNEVYKEIRTKFSQYYKVILNEDAYISWNINNNNNVDFLPPKVLSSGERRIDTAQGDGYTYTKLFCVCFDLAILTSYSTNSYYKFVYHDDVLANEDNGVKHRLLTLVRRLISEYDIQYIFSIIKDDLPSDDEDLPIRFDDSEIVLNLSDRDARETLFGFKF
ncbi:DUF2326 domain-containing protein [Tenacibaculum xiamenense]|uniref:DUF2326 domain-containing protein n=1 Tax=Tenacibaculum xiamenense TaxID=1261553 RepID=UPI003894023C